MFEEEKTITLIKPVTLGKGDSEQLITELNLREPFAGELEKASKSGSGVSMIITLISLVAKVPRVVAERLCQRDMAQASEYLSTFTNAGPSEAEAGQS